jgi:hypothetical protein
MYVAHHLAKERHTVLSDVLFLSFDVHFMAFLSLLLLLDHLIISSSPELKNIFIFLSNHDAFSSPLS